MKQVGDEIAPGDVLASIETDKAVVDFEMQEEGFIAALLYPEGAKDVELGKVVAIVVENKSDLDAFKNYTAESASAAAAPRGEEGKQTDDATDAAAACAKGASPVPLAVGVQAIFLFFAASAIFL